MNKARAIASLIMILLFAGCKGGTEPQGDPDATANWNVVATAPGETQAEAIEMIQAVMKLDAEGAKEFVATLPQVIASGQRRPKRPAATNASVIPFLSTGFSYTQACPWQRFTDSIPS